MKSTYKISNAIDHSLLKKSVFISVNTEAKRFKTFPLDKQRTLLRSRRSAYSLVMFTDICSIFHCFNR